MELRRSGCLALPSPLTSENLRRLIAARDCEARSGVVLRWFYAIPRVGVLTGFQVLHAVPDACRCYIWLYIAPLGRLLGEVMLASSTVLHDMLSLDHFMPLALGPRPTSLLGRNGLVSKTLCSWQAMLDPDFHTAGATCLWTQDF